jgi:hypothetical protein
VTYAHPTRSSPVGQFLQRSPYAAKELRGVTAVDAQAWSAHFERLISHAVSVRRSMLRDLVSGLQHEWRAATGHSSSLAEKKAHPAYKSIVEIGDEAIPAILESLEAQPDLLVMTLHDITGEDPVAPEHHGRLLPIIQDWLTWGAEHGYRQ